MASSKVSNGDTQTTGPKTSACITRVLGRRIEEHRGCVAVLRQATAATEQFGPGLYGLLHPLLDPRDFAGADQRPDLGLLKRGVADLQPAGGRGDSRGQRAGDPPIGEDPLHGNADLPGMIEAAFHQERQRVIEIGVGRHNHRRHAAMFQRAAGARGQLPPQSPADFAAADECEEGDPRIGDNLVGNVEVDRHQRLAPLLRQARFTQDLHEAEARERRGLGRFDDHGATGSQRRADLVGNQVQRVVEGREGQHRPDRLGLREGQASAGTRRAAHGNFLAGLRAQLLGAQAKAIDGPISLDQRIDQRLAAFPGGLQGQPSRRCSMRSAARRRISIRRAVLSQASRLRNNRSAVAKACRAPSRST